MTMTFEKLKKGIYFHKKGKLKKAEHLYNSVLETFPKHPDASHNLGVLNVSLNKYNVALPLFKTALEVNPRIIQFWLSYIDALIRDNQYEEAILILKRAKEKGLWNFKFDVLNQKINYKNIRLSPSNLQIEKLFEFYKSQKYKEAEELALAIIKQFPKDKVSWKILANIYNFTGRWSEGIKANEVAIKIDPKDAETYNNLGNIQCKIGFYEDAEINYRKV